jgi:hypothetical protein
MIHLVEKSSKVSANECQCFCSREKIKMKIYYMSNTVQVKHGASAEKN